MHKAEIRTPSKVSKVVLYSDRAIITRTMEIDLQVGNAQVIVEGLPENINEESFQVAGKGTATTLIADVKLAREYHQRVPDTTIQDLQNLLEDEQEKLKRIQDQLNVLENQRKFLDSVREFSADAFSRDVEVRPPSIEDWEKMLDFQGRNREKLNDQSYALQREQKVQSDKIQKLQNDLRQLQGAAGKWRKNGIVELETMAAGTLTLSLSYQIHSASWRPFYEARVNSETKTVTLSYYGLVEQKSGENWEEISLELSTARPHIGGNPPTFSPWYIRQFTPPPPAALRSAPVGGARKMKKQSTIEMSAAMPMAEADFGAAPAPKAAPTRTAEVQAGPGASVQFLVPGESDVPGDGTGSKHKILEEEFPCKFLYLALPKLAERVYLTAEFENTSEFPLLPGKMNIFRDGGFIGSANIKSLVTPGETFDLNLGVDEAIQISRKLLKRKGGEKGIFSKNRKMEYAFRIQVENKRKTDEEIVIRDQRPISQEEKIKIEIARILPDENLKKDVDGLPNGTIEWKLALPAGEKAHCELAFSVEYPNEMPITGLI